MNRKIRIAITHGDTNGIGYELILKAFAQPELLELCTPIVYGAKPWNSTCIGTASSRQKRRIPTAST